MFLLLLILFVGLPILEIYVITLVAGQIGGGATLLLLLAGVAAGALVIRYAWRRRPRSSDTALLVLAGFLLLIPGFVSDAVGLLLLLPPVRAVTKVWLGQRVERRLSSWNVQMWSTTLRPGPVVKGEVVEGEVVDDDEGPPR